MIRINLIPPEEVERSADQRQQAAIGALVVGCAVLVVVAVHGWQQIALMTATRTQSRLEREIAELRGPYEAVVQMEKQKKELQEKLAVIANLEAKKVGPVRMLTDLSTATPDKLWLTEFVETGGAARLSGLGVDEQTVADFLRRLAASPYFVSVDLEETSQVETGGVKHKRFVIRANINYAAGPPPAAPAAGDAERVAMVDPARGDGR
jgi:type IV pilus assembly protein PilN